MNTEEFEEFRHEAVHSLMALNEKCESEFNIGKWQRWDYDLDAGTLIFSENNIPRVIASVQIAGTTSDVFKNWQWGWANNKLPMKVVDRMHQVKAFGEAEVLPRLIEPFHPDDEYLGWEMAAIAAKILGAKGAYRCPVQDGFIYFVFVDIQMANSGDVDISNRFPHKSRIECENHGEGITTYICEHLEANPRQEWFSDTPSDSNPWPDAWCVKCSEIFREQGAWNDKNEGRMKIKILCHRCYERARSQGAPDR